MKNLNKLKLLAMTVMLLVNISFIKAQCVASYSYTDNGNGNFTFNNTSSGYSAGATYFWNFGDGNYSSLENPNYTYSYDGSYNVSFGIWDSICSDSIWQQITVTGTVNCNLAATFTLTNNGGGNYSFSNNSSGNYNYSFWDFGDGNYSYLTNPNHTYTTNGTYVIQLQIGDSNTSCVDYYVMTIQVTNGSSPCNGVASFTYTDNGNGNFTFNNTSTGYAAGATYFWNFDDGGYSSLENPNHTYTSNGTFYVSFGIDDSLCGDSIWQQITVSLASCNTSALFTYQDNGNGNFSFANASTGNNLAYLWNFGDGTNSTQANPNHTYLADGTYAISLFVYDTTDSTCFDYNVVTTIVSGTANSTSCNAAYIMFPDSNTNNIIVLNTSTGNNLSYFWSFGDGNTSTLAYPNYVYSTAGPFNLCLTVDDGNGCTSTYCDSIGSNGIVLKQAGFTINVQAPTTTEVVETENMILDFNAYPNPVKNNLTIELNLTDQSPVEITMVDLIGNTVALITNEVMSSGINNIQWNPSNISNGIYLLNIKTANELKIKKLVVNK
jgi:PKD repeat protein